MMEQLSPRKAMLRGLVDDGTVSMTWASRVMDRRAPFSGHRVAGDRIRGMLLGLAIGDSLGNTSEGMLPQERRICYGEVRDYLPNRHAGGRRVGLPSDDTQLAYWTLEHLLEHRQFKPDELAGLFCSRRIFGIGRTMSAFVRIWGQVHDWRTASQRSAGNGALMRIAPALIPHLAEAARIYGSMLRSGPPSPTTTPPLSDRVSPSSGYWLSCCR